MRKFFGLLLILAMTFFLFGCDLIGDLFTTKYTLVVDMGGSGSGNVLIEPDADDMRYKEDTVVTLTAVAQAGSVFMEWQGDKVSENAEIELLMDADKSVTAIFEQANVQGVVSDTRGGPALGNVKIYYEDNGEEIVHYADEFGNFEFYMLPDEPKTVYFEKEGFARGKAQDLAPTEGWNVFLEMPLRGEFMPGLHEPPNIEIKNLDWGQTVSGVIVPEIDITANQSIVYDAFAYFGGWQYGPENGWAIDTTLYPNGPTFLRVLAYDLNENVTVKLLPLIVDNDVVASELPGAIDYLDVMSLTFGMNLGWYSEQEQDLMVDNKLHLFETPRGQEINLLNLTEGFSVYNYLDWAGAENATGYRVYASPCGEDYRLLGSVTQAWFDDSSPHVVPDQKTYYKVVPYNSYGDGEAIYAYGKPLPSYNVYLEAPENRSNNVPVSPTFEWSIDADGEFDETVEFEFYFVLIELTDWIVDLPDPFTTKSYTLPLALDFNTSYTWDIYYSEGSIIYQMEEDSWISAYSYAGDADYFGAVNGEFIFTTTNGE